MASIRKKFIFHNSNDTSDDSDNDDTDAIIDEDEEEDDGIVCAATPPPANQGIAPKKKGTKCMSRSKCKYSKNLEEFAQSYNSVPDADKATFLEEFMERNLLPSVKG